MSDAATGTVHIVDDDQALLDSVRFFLEAHWIKVRTYCSAEDFLAQNDPEPGCLLLDLRMPGLSGIGLMQRLAEEQRLPPTVVLTAHGDVQGAVQAMKLGAIDFLSKPHDTRELLAILQAALSAGLKEAQRSEQKRALEQSLKTLTDRERQILRGIIRGRTSREIANELGLQSKSVEIYRGRVLAKLGFSNSLAMVRGVLSTGISVEFD